MRLLDKPETTDDLRFTAVGVRRQWDDGFGPLWLYLEPCGHWVLPFGVVRAESWESAWECVEDEILDAADESEIQEMRDRGELGADEIPEDCHYRNNGEPANGQGGYIGQSSYDARLVRLTPELCKTYKVSIRWEIDG